MYRLFRLAPCLPGLLLAAPVLAQDDEETPPCTPEVAEVASVEQLAAEFREWAGRCVRVRGLHAFGRYATQVSLFASPEAALAGGPGLAINYHNPADEHARHGPRWEEITGTFGSCVLQYEWLDAVMASNPDVLPMLGGLCHYMLDSHFIVPVSYAPSTGPVPARPRRSAVPLEQRQLEPLEVTGQADFAGRDAAERMLTILTSYSFDEFFALTEPRQAEEYAELTPLDLDPWALADLAELGRHFEGLRAHWRSFRPERDPRLFMLRNVDFDPEQSPAVELEDIAQAEDRIFCVLRQGFGIDDLPVRWADMDNQSARPYFCLQVRDALHPDEQYEAWVTVPFDVTGFPESAQ